MKKTYQSPEMNVVNVTATQHLLAGSGVETGSNVGKSYNSKDVTYSRGASSWDDED